MSNHTAEPWVIKKDMIYGNNEKESVACVLDGAWPYGIKPNAEANSQRIVSCVNALKGLSDDALEGGWNFKDMSRYCREVEQQRDELLDMLELVMDEWRIGWRYGSEANGFCPTYNQALALIAKAKSSGGWINDV